MGREAMKFPEPLSLLGIAHVEEASTVEVPLRLFRSSRIRAGFFLATPRCEKGWSVPLSGWGFRSRRCSLWF